MGLLTVTESLGASACDAAPGPSSGHLLVQALVISLLDYSNSLLAGLSASETKPLQCIQDAAAPRLQSTQTLPCDPPPP